MDKSGIPLSQRQALASALVSSFGQGTTGCTMSLFVNNITPSPLIVLADFTEATFTGYSRKTGITSFVTFNDAPSGDQIISATVLQLFAATAGVTPQTVYGWYLQDPALATLLAWGRFVDSYTFNAAGDKLESAAMVRLPPSTGQTG